MQWPVSYASYDVLCISSRSTHPLPKIYRIIACFSMFWYSYAYNWMNMALIQEAVSQYTMGCTNPGWQVTMVTEFYTLAPNICGCSV